MIGAFWERAFFVRRDALPAGVFRVLLGALLFTALLAAGPSWERFFAADGMLSLDPSRGHIDRWNVFYWTEKFWPVRVWWWIGLGAAAAFLAGLFTRLATIVLYVLWSSMVMRNPGQVNGEDQLFRMLLLYGCFAPLGRELSIDRILARRRGDPAPSHPYVWPVRLMQINVALIYVFSLPDKLTTDTIWRNGNAIYYTVVNNHWGRWPWPEMFYGGLLSRVFTWGTLLVEGAVPLLIWFRPTRAWVAGAAIALHVGIALLVANVTFFTLGMAAALCLFLPPELLENGLRRFRRKAPPPPPVLEEAPEPALPDVQPLEEEW